MFTDTPDLYTLITNADLYIPLDWSQLLTIIYNAGLLIATDLYVATAMATTT